MTCAFTRLISNGLANRGNPDIERFPTGDILIIINRKICEKISSREDYRQLPSKDMNLCSERILTPSFSALSYLDPGSAPATT